MNVSRVIPQSPFNTQSQDMLTFLQVQNVNNQGYLYQPQIEAVLSAKAQLDDPSKPSIALVVLPTGCGKTGVAVLAAYALNATRVLVITPSIIISRQVHEAFCGSGKCGRARGKCFLTKRDIINPDKEHIVLPSSLSYVEKSSDIQACLRDNLMVANAHKIGGRSNVKIEEIPSDIFDLVIVDEAHHYPAPTWKLLVDHFDRSKRLFLTATPEHKGKLILDQDGIPIQPCCRLLRTKAVSQGIIRDIDFDESDEPLDANIVGIVREYIRGANQKLDEKHIYACVSVSMKVEKYLNQHDEQDPSEKHQAMVLAQTKNDFNAASTFCDIYNLLYPGKCAIFVTGSKHEVLEAYLKGETRTLVVVGRLLEGFDYNKVSVVAIVRNVAKSSRVLFAQFVGRAVRKVRPDDPITAMIVSHPSFNQRANYEQFDKIAEEENVDEDEIINNTT